MSTAVIDASVFAYALLMDSDYAVQAIDACAQFATWAAPRHLDVECLSAWCSMVRRGEAAMRDAVLAVEELSLARIDRYDTHLLGQRIWELQGSVTAYDAEYVALAEDLDVPLLTLDSRLARAPGPRCEFLLVG